LPARGIPYHTPGIPAASTHTVDLSELDLRDMAAIAGASNTRRAILLVLFIMLFFVATLNHNHYKKSEYVSGEIKPPRTIYYYYFGGRIKPPRKYLFFGVIPNRQVNLISS